jgi:DNA polymerase-3 subunit delta
MKPFTFICGEDEFLVAQAAKQKFEQLGVQVQSDFSKEIVSGTAATVNEVEAIITKVTLALQTHSLWEERKLVWLKNVNFLSESVTSKAEGTKKQVERLQQVLLNYDANSIDLIISADSISRRTKEFKWFQAHSEYLFVSNDQQGMELFHQQILDLCKQKGITLQPAAWSALIERVHATPRVLFQEIEKLITYLGREEKIITEAMVLELVSVFGENDFFEISNAFFDFDLPACLKAIRAHFEVHSEARSVLASLQNRNRLILQLKALIELNYIRVSAYGINKNDWESLKVKYTAEGSTQKSNSLNIWSQNSWYVGKLAILAEKQPLERWAAFQQEFLRVFKELLVRPQEPCAVLSEMVIRC